MTALGARFETTTRETGLSQHLTAALRPFSLLTGLTAAGVLLVY